MSSIPSHWHQGLHALSLRLFVGDSASDDGLSPRWTLGEFFEQWYLPIVLKGERNSRPTTVGLYRDALGYWSKITGDPPIEDINAFTLAAFQEGLRTATYKRGKLGQERPLGKMAVQRHLRNIRTLLFRTGPTIDPNRPGTGLLDVAPHIRLTKVKAKLKSSFALATAKRIVAAAIELDRPSITGITAVRWWRLRLGLAFYTGLRSGTIHQLQRRHMVIEDDGHTWLHVPEELVTKTDKESHIVLHPLALEAIESCKRSNDPNGLLCPAPHCNRYLQTLHERLQKLAGVPEAKWQSPHVWRRIHAEQLALLGLRETTEIARRALDHSDDRTTTSHYVDIVNKFRLKLPALWEDHAEDLQQRLF